MLPHSYSIYLGSAMVPYRRQVIKFLEQRARLSEQTPIIRRLDNGAGIGLSVTADWPRNPTVMESVAISLNDELRVPVDFTVVENRTGTKTRYTSNYEFAEFAVQVVDTPSW